MRTFTMSFLFLIVNQAVLSQVLFQRYYSGAGSFEGFSVWQTAGGGYVVAGGGTSFCMIETDSIGDTLWTKTYDSYGTDDCYAASKTYDGGFILGGRMYDAPNLIYHIRLLRTDSSGNLIWTKTIGGSMGEGAYSIQQSNDKGYILSGYSHSYAGGFVGDCYLVKTDSLGNLKWTKTFGEVSFESGRNLIQNSDNGFLILGHTGSFGDNQIFLIKTDSLGNLIWTKTYGKGSGFSVIQTMDGGYIIAGSKPDTTTLIFDDLSLIKIDSAGNIKWAYNYGGYLHDDGSCVRQTSDGGFIVVGISNSFGNENLYHGYAIKTDSIGNVLWSKLYGDADNVQINAVDLTNDGGFIMAGSTSLFGANPKSVYLIKTDSAGNSGCLELNTGTSITTPSIIVTVPAWIDSSGGVVLADTVTIGNFNLQSDPCTTLGLQRSGNNAWLQLFPNPSGGEFFIEADRDIEIEIYDYLGKILIRDRLVNATEKKYKPVNFPAGIYFVKATDENTCILKKLVVY